MESRWDCSPSVIGLLALVLSVTKSREAGTVDRSKMKDGPSGAVLLSLSLDSYSHQYNGPGRGTRSLFSLFSFIE